MPVVDSNVGPAQLPSPVGATDAALADPAEDALVDYVAFWLRWGLNAKFATMTRPRRDPDVQIDASPVENRYTNPPNAVYTQRRLPALFLWWDGKSTRQQRTITQWMRVRSMQLLYVFECLKGPDVVDLLKRYSGLIETADATLHRAFDRLSHPNYAYGSFSAGTDIRDMFSLRGVEYLGGQEGFLKELVQASARGITTAAGKRGAESVQGGVASGYPTLSGTIRVYEDIGDDTVVDPDDALRDGSLRITNDRLPMLDRYLPQPDGTEPGSGFPQD